jgi:Ca2+-binding RTX toxin-like protein
VRKGFATLNLKVSGTLAMSDFIIASNTLGTTADDVLTGDLEDNYIQMEHGGDDSAAGSGGDDLFYFGAAWTPGDRVDGGDGRDTVLLQGRYPLAVFGAGNLDSVEELRLIRSTLSNYGGQGGGPNDYTIVFTDAAAVGSYFSVDGTWLSAGERLVFDGSAETATPLTVQGGDGADDLKGGGAVDSLIGGPGADILDGGGGGDYLKGGHGDDIYIVDGGDIVTEAAGSGTDTIQASGDAVLGANVENLVLTGSADSNGTGNDLANSITGNGGANILRGGGGADLLTGGGGADIFRYGAASDSTAAAYDTILDFQSGIDKLDLSALNPTGVTLTDHGSYREVLAQTAGGPFSVRISGQIAMADIDLGTPPAGTPGDDSIVGTEREDIIRVEQGGIDFVGGNGGNDVFYFGAAFTAADQVDGGAGDDRLIVRGSYPNLVLGSGNLTNVERLVLLSSGNSAYEPAAAGPFSYAVTLFDPAVTAVSLVVDASGLGANEILTFNGAQESGAALLVTGGAGGDALTGGLGNDSLNGGAGDDNLAGGAGIDQLEGGAGNDRLDGGVGADAQAGGAGDDVYVIDNAGDSVTELAGGGSDTVESLLSHTLGAEIENLVLLGTALSGTGNGLANRITGNGANNVLDGMAGADITTGGTGDDLYRVDDAGDSVVEASGAGTDSVEAAVTHTLGAHVENLTLIGSTAIDGSGNDLANIILGNDAANVLAGHGGNDVLNGGAGADVMSGGTGDDVYVVDQEGDSVSEAGGGGVDRVQSAVAWVLADGFEVLTLTGSAAIAGTGNAADNSLYGNGAANFLNGAGGADQMYGGNGDDIYIVDHLNDRANETSAGGGTDEVQSSVSFQLEANVENLTLTGTGDTTGVGNALANVLIGNTGNNTLSGAAGADTMSGGLGHDVYWVDDAGDVVNEAESAGIDRAESAISYTLGLHVDNLTLTGTAANGTGNGLANVIIGNASANTLSGGDGDDTLDGKAGADTMIGGYGYDIYFVDDAGDVVSETFTGDLDTVQSLISYTLGANLDILTLAGTGHINGTGNLLGNVLNGNAGHNVLDGGGGADNMFGGLGNDTYIISDLGDKAFETSSVGGNDHVLSAISFQLGSNIEKLTLTGTGNTNGFGNENSNTLIGNGGNNTLSGGAGADTMTGGAGHDIYYVDVAGDVVNEAAAEGTDTVNSAITYTLGANLENLTLTGSAALNGTGNELNNVITGNAGANSLNGGNGNDTLTGGLGADTLNGGSGDDTYVIDGSDTLVEFAGGGNDTVQTSQSYTLLAEFEYLTLTGSLNVNGTGNAANNVLNGNAGNNTLDGGAGADNMFGGLGNDTYVVDNVLDRASENSALGGTDTVMSSVSFTLGANVENLTLTASGNVSGIGNDLANVINGNAGDNLISGGLGADALSGGAGNDSFLYGAAAHSTAAARDTILSFASGDKINLAQIDANATTTGTNDAFTFIGSGAFSNVAGQLRAYKSGTEWIVEGDTNGDGTADLVIGLTTVNPAIVAADFVL